MDYLKPLVLYTNTSIALRIFGLFFTLFALMFMLIPYLVGDIEMAFVNIFNLIPMVFILVGLGFITYRQKVVLDKINKTITKSWGFIVFLSNSSQILGKVDYVYLTKETRGSGKNRKTVYPVYLVSDTKSKVEIQTVNNNSSGRLAAEKIAKYLESDMEDVSTGVVRRRKYEDLDRNIREQIQAGGESVRQVYAPLNSKMIVLDEKSDHLELKLPKGPWGMFMIIIAGVIAAFITIFFWASGFFTETLPDFSEYGINELKAYPGDLLFPLLVLIPFYAFPFIIFVVGLFKLLPKKLYISYDEVKLKKGLLYLSRESINVEELEEVFNSKDTLYLVSDEQQIKVPTQLEKEDFEYIIQSIRYYAVYGSRGYQY